MNRRIPFAPVEGWLTLVLVIVICLTMAWSIDDVALVLGRGDFTDFLAPVAVAGVLVGFIAAKVGWGRWLTYLIGAIFAALFVPLVVGAQLPDPGGAQLSPYARAADSMVQAVFDLSLRRLQFTPEFGHYMVILGLAVWGTSMFASYATFGHRRPLNAIVVVGVVLLINMSLTLPDQLFYLVVFSLASLLLLVRYHVLDEQSEWVRRRIGDPASLSGIYMRGGAVFIGLAVLSSVLLTNIARSAPLEGAWYGFSAGIIELSRSLARFTPSGGQTRQFGSDFDPSGTSIRGQWNPDNSLIATIKLEIDEERKFYWRAVTYDRFNINGWVASEPVEDVRVAAGDPLLAGTLDAGDPSLSQEIRYDVTPSTGGGAFVLAPLTPGAVSQPADVALVGDGAFVNSIERQGGGTYEVSVLLRREGDEPGQLSQAALRGAGTGYPAEVEATYLEVPEGAIPEGGEAEALLEQLVAEAPDPANPFDFALYLSQRFKDSTSTALFTYDTNVLDLMDGECKDLSTVECFAIYKRGFCQWYATTMAIFLREQGIPTRIVEGYLPAQRTVQGEEQIKADKRHQWVEVYFPGYGWWGFDPTGGSISEEPSLSLTPGVADQARPSIGPLGSASIPSGPPRDEEPDDATTPLSTGGTPPLGPFILVLLLLSAVVGGVAFTSWQRGPRSGTSADHAYRTVTRLAARFGFGPRPNQTVYEYAGTLGEVLPIVRPELETVARAKVETVYGRGVLGDERVRALRDAERRLRLNLLRLAFRRGDRRRR